MGAIEPLVGDQGSHLLQGNICQWTGHHPQCAGDSRLCSQLEGKQRDRLGALSRFCTVASILTSFIIYIYILLWPPVIYLGISGNFITNSFCPTWLLIPGVMKFFQK